MQFFHMNPNAFKQILFRLVIKLPYIHINKFPLSIKLKKLKRKSKHRF